VDRRHGQKPQYGGEGGEGEELMHGPGVDVSALYYHRCYDLCVIFYDDCIALLSKRLGHYVFLVSCTLSLM
jgi:hypothetical protein